MDILELRKKLSKYKSEKQSLLNDTYMWVKVSRDAIANLNEEKIVFEVPSTNGKVKEIKRKKPSSLKNRIMNSDIYNSAYVMMVSIVEDYLNKIIKLLLTFDNNRIKVTIPDMGMQSTIDIVDFINQTKEETVGDIINQRVDKMFYASPKKQLEYLEKAIGINIKKEEWFKWIEYKARRDVIIHNDCKINEVYCRKVEGYGKYNIGEKVVFNEQEFTIIVLDFKGIIGKIDYSIRNEYHIPSYKDAVEFFSKKDMDMLDKLIGGDGV